MSNTTDLAFACRVLAAFDDDFAADSDCLWWRTDGPYAPVTFFVICNDLFSWGCADLEPITQDNVAILEQATADCLAIDKVCGGITSPSLFCARMRKMRPQGACYDHIESRYWHLFDACGPVREVGLGNPRKHPSERVEKAPV